MPHEAEELQPQSEMRERESAPESEVRETVEYLGQDGRVLGRAEIVMAEKSQELDEKDTYANQAVKSGRELKSFVIIGEKEGKPARYDILARTGMSKADVIVSDATDSVARYFYRQETNRAVIPQLDTPLGAGVALHEFGHGSQANEEKYQRLGKHTAAAKDALRGNPPGDLAAANEMLNDIFDLVPGSEDFVTQEEFDRYAETRRKVTDALDARDDAAIELHRNEKKRRKFVADFVQKELRQAFSSPEAADLDASTDIQAKLEALGFEFGGPDMVDPPGELDFDAKPVPLPSSLLLGKTMPGELLNALRSKGVANESSMTKPMDADGIVIDIPFSSGMLRGYSVKLRSSARGKDAMAQMMQLGMFRENARKLRENEAKKLAELKEAEDASREVFDETGLRDLLALPVKVAERDATRRAYQWMREIKQETGVDLFESHRTYEALSLKTRGKKPAEGEVKAAALANEDDCGEEAPKALESEGDGSIVTDNFSELSDAALKTYRAQHPPRRKRPSLPTDGKVG